MKRFLVVMVAIVAGCERPPTKTDVDPNPIFDAAFVDGTRVEFVSLWFDSAGDEPLAELTDPSDVDDFLALFAFETFPEGSWEHCMCTGEPEIRVWSGDVLVDRFTIHHGRSIRWNAFETDLALTESSSRSLKAWLAGKDIRCD